MNDFGRVESYSGDFSTIAIIFIVMFFAVLILNHLEGR